MKHTISVQYAMNDTPNADIKNAQKVLNNEIDGLSKLNASIDQSFSDAAQVIDQMKNKPGAPGRLIVAGIGKSGHVARKIAATMASTGTPSYFVHPGEASHGDLGMVTENDIVLMLSNSGENAELSDLIHYTRRYGITLIAMTSNPESTLATHSDIQLLLPKVPESCPNGLAPTTSTTMMIALGDALAVALLERMGLTKEQYKKFHPGGKLGQRLMKVEELMIGYTDLPLVNTKDTLDKAILVLSEKNLGSVIVISDEKDVAGIITDGDLKRHMDANLLGKTVTEVMTYTPHTISENMLAVEALEHMTNKKDQYLTSLLVMDENKRLKGMIRLQDCLQAGLT